MKRSRCGCRATERILAPERRENSETAAAPTSTAMSGTKKRCCGAPKSCRAVEEILPQCTEADVQWCQRCAGQADPRGRWREAERGAMGVSAVRKYDSSPALDGGVPPALHRRTMFSGMHKAHVQSVSTEQAQQTSPGAGCSEQSPFGDTVL